MCPKKMDKQQCPFTFKLAKPNQKQLIVNWIKQDHIKEWIHGNGLKNLLENLDAFYEDKTDSRHWIAYYQDQPFAYLLTFPEGSNATTLDLFICDLNYMGKGLAVPMIQEFLLSHFQPHVVT